MTEPASEPEGVSVAHATSYAHLAGECQCDPARRFTLVTAQSADEPYDGQWYRDLCGGEP